MLFLSITSSNLDFGLAELYPATFLKLIRKKAIFL